MTQVLKAVLSIVMAAAPAAALAELPGGPLEVRPSLIEIGLLYRVPPIQVAGQAPPGSQVLVAVRGEDKEETYNKKVQAGPIWISSGKVHISGAPSLFLLFSSAPIDSPEAQQALATEALTPAAIRQHIHVDAGAETVDEDALRASFLAMKLKNGFYQVHNGGVSLERAVDGGAPFSLRFEWPGKASPGTYTVTAYAWHQDGIRPIASRQLHVAEAGFAAFITRAATERPAYYGVAAIILAMLAGFGIDFLAARLFGRKQRPAH
jgi:hypothetical protein